MEVIINGRTYTNILDLAARVSFLRTAEAIALIHESRLTTGNGNVFTKESLAFLVILYKQYRYYQFTVQWRITPDAVQYTLPIVCTKMKGVEVRSSTSILIYKEKAAVKVRTTGHSD